jgi:hypothetical protein
LYTERASAIESIRPMTRCHAPTDVRLGASVWTAASSHGWAKAGIPGRLLSLCPLPERGLLGQGLLSFPIEWENVRMYRGTGVAAGPREMPSS